MASQAKPSYYATPLKSRDKITDFLTSNDGWDCRGGYSYDHENWLFCFDVKLHSVDLDFDKLREDYAGNSEGSPLLTDARYIERLRAKYDEEFDAVNGTGGDTELLWEWAVEDARRSFHGGKDQRPDDDGWNALWDGSVSVHARFGFMGRSGGWLVLKEFGIEGGAIYKLTTNSIRSIQEMDFPTLKALYQYIITLLHDLREPHKEVEYQAAFNFFENIAADVQTTAQIDAEEARLVTVSIGENI